MKFVCPLIVVEDIEKSRNFYEKILGQKIKYDFGENIEFTSGFSIHLEEHFKKLIHKQDVFKKAHNFELYFEENEIEKIFYELKQNEVDFLHEIVEQPWGQRVMRFYDPDFHIIEIGESLEAVVLRYYNMGMCIEAISAKTSMPVEFIEKVIDAMHQ